MGDKQRMKDTIQLATLVHLGKLSGVKGFFDQETQNKLDDAIELVKNLPFEVHQAYLVELVQEFASKVVDSEAGR